MEEISIFEILGVLYKRKWWILIITIFFSLGAYLWTCFFIEPTYASYSSLYVDNGAEKTTTVTSTNDLDAAQELVKTYIQILQSNTAVEKVIQNAHLNLSVGGLLNEVTLSSLNDTEVLQFAVVSTDPAEAERIASTYLTVAPGFLESIVDNVSVQTIDEATDAVQVGPDTVKNALLGFCLGLVLSCGIVIVGYLLDNRIKGEEELISDYEIPVLAVIPMVDDNKIRKA